MREILFRGKTLGSNMWIYGDLRQYPSGAKSIKSAELIHTVEVYPATIGQYTGLKDRNGRRIFEGDIIKLSDGYIDAIVYNDECAASELRGGGCTLCLSQVYERLVIGNIHDNPELLKEGGQDA